MGKLDGIDTAADEVIEDSDRLHIALAAAKDRADWWQDACEKSTEREKKLTAGLIAKDPIIQGLKKEITTLKREVNNLRRKLTALGDASEDIEDDDEYEKDEGTSYVAENGFDMRDHYREM